MKLIRLFGIAILALGMTMASCSIEDGKDGINGIDGADGQDGAGLEDLTKYGAVTLNLSETRPDGIVFEDSAIYQFTPIDPDDFDEYNIVTITQVGNDTKYYFNFRRFFSIPESTYTTTYLDWELRVTNLGEQTQNIDSVIIYIKHGVIGDDYKYFMINQPFESGGAGISEMVFSNLAFDPNAANRLSFSYSFTVDAANNSSGNELSVSGTVDINLLEKL